MGTGRFTSKRPTAHLPVPSIKTPENGSLHPRQFPSRHQPLPSLDLPKPLNKPQALQRRRLTRRLSLHSIGAPVEGSSDDEKSQQKVIAVLRLLFRLWCHENARVYADRLANSRDKVWLSKVLDLCVKYCFCGAKIQSGVSESGIADSVTSTARDLRGRMRPGARPKPRMPSVAATSMRSGSSQLAAVTISVEDIETYDVSMELLLSLLPKESQVQFIPYDQVVMRGEDLSCLMFAKLPVKETQEECKPQQETQPSTHTQQQHDSSHHEVGGDINGSDAGSDDQSMSDTGTSTDGCEQVKKTFG